MPSALLRLSAWGCDRWERPRFQGFPEPEISTKSDPAWETPPQSPSKPPIPSLADSIACAAAHFEELRVTRKWRWISSGRRAWVSGWEGPNAGAVGLEKRCLGGFRFVAKHPRWNSTNRRWFALDVLCQVGPGFNLKREMRGLSAIKMTVLPLGVWDGLSVDESINGGQGCPPWSL